MEALKNRKQRFGIELEMYLTNGDMPNHSRQNCPAIAKAKDYMKNNSLRGYKTTYDYSLRNTSIYSGAEIITRPVMLKSAKKKIADLNKLVTGTGAFFMETEGKFCGPVDCKKSVIENDGNYNGSTGLHIHFEMPKQGYSICDLFRLVNLHSENYEQICKLAWRKDSSRWAGSAKEHYKFEDFEDFNTFIHCMFNKYTGLNLANAYRKQGKRTIEFRYGHASLALDSKAMYRYINYLVELFDEAFTGEPTATIGRFEITELAVDRNGRSMVSIKDTRSGQTVEVSMPTNMKTW